MAKQKRTLIKEQLKKRIQKYDDESYLIYIPIQQLSPFRIKFINTNILKQYAQHWKIQKKQRKNSHIKLCNYQICGYDYLLDKDKYKLLYEFYYDLLLRDV